MDRDALIRRGRNAAATLGNDQVISILDEIQKECDERFANSKPDDKQGREEAYWLRLSARSIVDKLTSWRDTGQVEEANAKTDREGKPL